MKTIAIIIAAFMLTACEEEGEKDWSDCLQSIGEATPCESADPDPWQSYMTACGTLEDRASRSDCLDEYQAFLVCLDEANACY